MLIAGTLRIQIRVIFEYVAHPLPTWSNDSYSTIIPCGTLEGND